MIKRVFLFISIFIFFLFLFFIEKAAFFLFNSDISSLALSVADFFRAWYNGLGLDLSMSGYLSVIPSLMLLASVWLKDSITNKILNVYFLIVIVLIVIIGVADIVLYPYWGFHFDSSVFLYLKKPADVLASSSGLEIGLSILAVLITSSIFYFLYKFAISSQIEKLKVPKSPGRACVLLFLLTATLFIPIRGGFTVSTMNVGKAYFSDNMFLNHLAVNPQFNLLYSMTKSENFASQYQFYSQQEAEQLFDNLNSHSDTIKIQKLLTSQRPNVILFMLESFSGNVVEATGGIEGVAPNLSRLAKEGVLFDNFYANSFRTDRGLVSILSGYPAHPTVAMMKYPQKTQSLPAIPKTLKDAGYGDLAFYYGGDADFANMRSFIIGTCGIADIISDKAFPISERMTKWGAPDKFLFERLYNDLQQKQESPYFKLVLTLSSHEPFDVPTHKFDEPFLNAVNYTDSCIGAFTDKLKASGEWDNTLLIFVADHCMQSYPQGVANSDSTRFHIPMIWSGGAVKQPVVISDFGSQNDLAATLLSQLGLSYSDFRFSKDMLNKSAQKFAFYSYVNGFSMLNDKGSYVYDNDRKTILRQVGDTTLERKSKAFFQTMYLDLGNR